MAGRVSVEEQTSRPYSAPILTFYGAVTTLTANGSKNSIESNGGTCGTVGDTKIRC